MPAAARSGDMHTCPMVTGVVPHVGGPILFGSLNVWVGNTPQARRLDPCFCVGPPDLITGGEMTTLVGMAGAFAGGLGGFLGLLLGGFLAGLRNLIDGYPRAAADPNEPDGYYTQYSKGVHVRGTADFQERVITDLNAISSTDTGSNTIRQIDESGHITTIKEGSDYSTGYTDPAARLRSSVGGPNNTGTDSTITYTANPITVYDGSRPWMNIPSDVGLLHKMRHASDAARGAMDPGESMIDGRLTRNREAQATGIGPYATDPYTENSYRNERTLPPPQTQREWY